VQFAGPGQPFSYATSFPMPIVLSAAFDDNLVYEVADTISTEFRAYSNAGRDSFDAYTPNLST
jgi:xylan 1,4-beta-xylosidase